MQTRSFGTLSVALFVFLGVPFTSAALVTLVRAPQALARSIVRQPGWRTPAPGNVVLLENRDAKSYRWRMKCTNGEVSGALTGDGVIRFQPRGSGFASCTLSLVGSKSRLVVVSGDRVIVRNGRLARIQLQTVLFPPPEVFGDVSLARNPKLKRQWAIVARASTEYSRPAWSAMQATGPANVTTCSDNSKAWAPRPKDAGREWLELGFRRKVRAIGALIHVSYNPGAIVEVQAKTGSGWVRIWRGKDTSRGHCPSVFAVRFQEPVDTDGLRIVLDTRLVSGWNEVDAVQLVSQN